MIYKLDFNPAAFKEWKKLGDTVREQFKSKLQERLTHPHVASARLTGVTNLYKIKLRSAGYRLVYTVQDDIVTVVILAVGKRERNEIYKKAFLRVPSYEQ